MVEDHPGSERGETATSRGKFTKRKQHGVDRWPDCGNTRSSKVPRYGDQQNLYGYRSISVNSINLAVEGPEVPCNQCGAMDTTTIFEPGVAQVSKIVRCNQCRLMYASPRGEPIVLESYASNKPTGLLDDVMTNPKHSLRMRMQKEAGQIGDFDKTRQTLNRIYPNQGRMLELGSSFGFLLKSFKDEGWDVVGVDPWQEVASFTKRELGFETITSTLEDANIPDESVDVVVMLHVIEHVPDPLQSMQEIRRILKPGGHLVMETPRYDSTMFRLLGRRERSVRHDGHIYFFELDTMKRLYEKAGYEEVETLLVGRTLTAERFLWNAANITRSQTIKAGFDRVKDVIPFHKIGMYMNLKDMMRVCIRKV